MKSSEEQIIEKFHNLTDRESVADILEISDSSLRYFLYSEKLNTKYYEFKISKKNGQNRLIHAPDVRLKNIQVKLNYILSLVYKPKLCTTGFVKSRNIVDNAKKHSNKGIVLNIDLKDFFHSIHYGRVKGMLKSKPYSIGDEAAAVIAQLVVYFIDDNISILPQGAPTSPIISNMICKPMDNKFLKFCTKNKISYTRYADDITFSSFQTKFPKEICSINYENNNIDIGYNIKEIIKDNGFEINKDKVYYRKNNTRQEVTGLVVNKFPNVKREYVSYIRGLLNRCRNNGVDEVAVEYVHRKNIKNISLEDSIKKFRDHMKGKINFLRVVKGSNDYTYLKYAKEYNELFPEDIFEIGFIYDKIKYLDERVFVINSFDSGGVSVKQGTAFNLEGYGIISCNHCFTEFEDHWKEFGKKENYIMKKENFFDTYDEELCKLSELIFIENNKKKNSDDFSYSYNILYQNKKLPNSKVTIICNREIDYKVFLSQVFDNGKTLKCGNSDSLNIGDTVYIVGYPDHNNSKSITINKTIIINYSYNYRGSDAYFIDSIVVPGTSGGPVLNSDGEVVGIVKFGLKKDGIYGDNGFVPINTILNNINEKK